MSLLASPRRRRRVVFGAVVVVVAAPLAYLGVHFSSPGSAGNATGPYVKDSFYRKPKHVPFTADERRAVRSTLRDFIRTAVARRDVVESWKLAGPVLREGLTRRKWATGAIPVQPYPVANHGQGAWSTVQYSYRNKVGLEVLLFPSARVGLFGRNGERGRRAGTRRPLEDQQLDVDEVPWAGGDGTGGLRFGAVRRPAQRPHAAREEEPSAGA